MIYILNEKDLSKDLSQKVNTFHCVKSVRIWSFCGLYFPAFRLGNFPDIKEIEFGFNVFWICCDYESIKCKIIKILIMAAFDVAWNSYRCHPARSVDILIYSLDPGLKLYKLLIYLNFMLQNLKKPIFCSWSG